MFVDMAHIARPGRRRGRIPRPCPMPTWSPPPRTRPCAARAAASSSARRSSPRRSTPPSSPAPRAARSCTSSPARPSASGRPCSRSSQSYQHAGRAATPQALAETLLEGRRPPRLRRHRQPPDAGRPVMSMGVTGTRHAGAARPRRTSPPTRTPSPSTSSRPTWAAACASAPPPPPPAA